MNVTKSEADTLLCYAFGLTDCRPRIVELNIDPDRVSDFGRGKRETGDSSMRTAVLDQPEKETTEFVTTARRVATERGIPVH